MKRLQKGDLVRVVAGKDKGKEGKILGFTKKGDRVLIEKVNIVKRHQRPTQANQLGGIVEKEAGVHVSNVMVLTPNGHPTRVQFLRETDDGGKSTVRRYSAKHEEYLD